MDKIKKSLILNIIIFILVLLGTIFMMTGFQFMGKTHLLASTGISPFKFYTVDSNVLAGLSSLILIIYEYLILKNKINNIPRFVYLFKYISVVGVSLTFIVTLFYLSPLYGDKFIFLYKNSNLIFHLIVPILSFISFVLYEKTELRYKDTLYGISTMIIYGIYYIINIIMHQENGVVSITYDWYSFVRGGLSSIFIVFPVILLVTYLISLFVYKLARREI